MTFPVAGLLTSKRSPLSPASLLLHMLSSYASLCSSPRIPVTSGKTHAPNLFRNLEWRAILTQKQHARSSTSLPSDLERISPAPPTALHTQYKAVFHLLDNCESGLCRRFLYSAASLYIFSAKFIVCTENVCTGTKPAGTD